jgi:hypothetical protein
LPHKAPTRGDTPGMLDTGPEPQVPPTYPPMLRFRVVGSVSAQEAFR